MKLKRTYPKQDDIPEQFRGLYEETGDGKWTLTVEFEGMTTTKRVDEFRTINLKMKERLEAYGDKEFGNGEVTPDIVTELVAKKKDFEDGNLTKASDVQKRVDERTQEMRDKHAKDLKAATDKNAALTVKLERAVIEAKALEAGAQFGLKKTAAQDLVDRVLKIFKIDDNGEAVAYQEDGKTIRHGADDEPLKIQDFVKKLATNEGKHLFEDNGGGGGNPGVTGSRQNDGNEINPWDEKHFNRTHQTEMIKADPDKAERMAKRAGVNLTVGEATRSAHKAGIR